MIPANLNFLKSCIILLISFGLVYIASIVGNGALQLFYAVIGVILGVVGLIKLIDNIL